MSILHLFFGWLCLTRIKRKVIAFSIYTLRLLANNYKAIVLVYNVLYIILKKDFLYIGLRSLVVTGKSDSMRPKRFKQNSKGHR